MMPPLRLAFGLLALTLLTQPLASAGVGAGGGGDPCQNRFEEIRNNLDDWIDSSKRSTAQHPVGSAQLDFSTAHTDLTTYNDKMRGLIALSRLDSQTSISCTSDPLKVRIAGAEKLCTAHLVGGRPRILCYRGKTDGNGKYIDGFLAAPEEQQYFQVHHEFAVLAEFEDQTGDETNYPLSNQISAKLKSYVVKKLPVEGVDPAAPAFLPEEGVYASDAGGKYCNDYFRADGVIQYPSDDPNAAPTVWLTDNFVTTGTNLQECEKDGGQPWVVWLCPVSSDPKQLVCYEHNLQSKVRLVWTSPTTATIYNPVIGNVFHLWKTR